LSRPSGIRGPHLDLIATIRDIEVLKLPGVRIFQVPRAVTPRLDLPILSGHVRKGIQQWSRFIVSTYIKLTIGADKICAEEVDPIAVRFDLQVLA
jgi:hypothetical protein